MVTTTAGRVENLPADMTRLVGRRAETAAVKRLLSESRLVTLTGTGGVGKTRLAIHVARQVRSAFRDGVCLVSLAELTRPQLIAPTLMAALSGTGQAPRMPDLVAAIRDRQLLLVLDNCEHLAEAAAGLVAGLLGQCPDLRVLATSRERLRVEGEALYSVPTLAVPEPGKRLSPGELARYDAITLFIERASSLDHSREFNASEEAALVDLCRHLDGLPLAIELVAGRSSSLPLHALLERQDDRFRLLASGTRSAPLRHQTLRATVDYSFELCSEHAQLLWARIAVFARGCTLEAVTAVCGDGSLPVHALEQALAELVDKSIVSFDGARYGMLEIIRSYGLERLLELGQADELRGDHRDHFAAVAERHARSGAESAGHAGISPLLADHANVRAALDFCLSDSAQVSAGLRLASSMWGFWISRGLQREGRHWLDELLALDTSTTPERAEALWVAGYLAVLDGDLGVGLTRARECRQLAEQLSDRASLARALFVQGQAELFIEHVEDALSDLDAAIRLEREVAGESPVFVTALTVLGSALLYVGEVDRAGPLLEEARVVCRTHGYLTQEVWAVLIAGLVAVRSNRVGEAEGLLKEALELSRSTDDLLAMSAATEYLGWAALAKGDADRGARLMGVSQAVSEPFGSHLSGFRGLLEWHDERVQDGRDLLGLRSFDEAFQDGRQMDAQDAIAFALDERRPPSANAVPGDGLPLTRREREVAQLVAEGMTNREIAGKLVISQRTAEAHVEHILNKLGFASRNQIVALFARERFERGPTK